MKRTILFIISLLLLATGAANAVVLGDNVRAPYFDLFGNTSWPKYEQMLPGGALEILATNFSQSIALGVGGRYHLTMSDQEKYIPYSTAVVVVTPVVYPPFVFTSPDVLDAAGNLAPQFAGYHTGGNSFWDGYSEGGGIATASAVQYLVQGKGFRVVNVTTGAFVGKYTVRAVNMTTKLVVWSKTYLDGPILTTPNIMENRCQVKDIDGDGNDELIVYRTLRLTPTTQRQYVDVFNIATGVAKRATLTWVDNR